MKLSPQELRGPKASTSDDKVISYVHTYNPYRPNLMKNVRDITSRLFTSKECRGSFGDVKIINSQREPSSLLRLFQHSRFDEFRLTDVSFGVSKCGSDCRLCEQIMEVDSVFFRNSGIYFKIRHQMDCSTRNLIYAIFCIACGKSYIGESVNLRDRMAGHRSKTKHATSTSPKVNKHIHDCGQGFQVCPLLKLQDDTRITRLVYEDQLVKLLKPDLNADTRNLLHLQLKD